MEVFYNHLYEYKKGIRNLILHTTSIKYKKQIIRKLKKNSIDFLIHHVSDNVINVYFGDCLCMEMVRNLNKPKLSDLSHEEDFILGILLGYSMLHQCRRYLDRVNKGGSLWMGKAVNLKGSGEAPAMTA
ncbi:MAG TPA: DUF2023 family protein [Spirochaetota bacterium]|nr:DUF2023 family protein [Spirochaetota bacterium]HPI90410.1 DUF2023 family protein [Spirochaetota bacterium]HPR48507.1 DUF2023 family protein [Spirochaetota bacterium]